MAISVDGRELRVWQQHTLPPTRLARAPRARRSVRHRMVRGYESCWQTLRALNRFLTKMPSLRFELPLSRSISACVDIDDADRLAGAPGVRLGGVLHLQSRCVLGLE